MTVTLEQAQADLPTLVRGLVPGQEIVITDGERTVAKLVADPPLRPVNILPGSVLYMAPDFDDPLEEFEDDPIDGFKEGTG